MGESSSIKSNITFVSYKVDEFKFETSKNLTTLSYSENNNKTDWDISLAIKQPIYFKTNNTYISGINCRIIIISNSEKIGELHISISGLFQSDGKIELEDETNLVKYQFPAILFPYLRSTVTTFIANAGFGTFIFPLINVVELSKATLKDVEIKSMD